MVAFGLSIDGNAPGPRNGEVSSTLEFRGQSPCAAMRAVKTGRASGRPSSAFSCAAKRSGVLQALRCPTLLLCGRQDAWSPLARHEEMQAMVAGSRLVLAEDSGHMSPMEQPQAVNAALREWPRD